MPGGIPICVYEAKLGLFRVLQNKGKSFSSGGFGIVCSSAIVREHSSRVSQESFNGELENDEKNDDKQTATANDNLLFLFIEETMFLHERGLIEVLKKEDDISKFESAELFHLMLHELHLPIQVYLTYAHLRSQTFIVNRHSSYRFNLIKRTLEKKSFKNQNCLPNNEVDIHTENNPKSKIDNCDKRPSQKESKSVSSSNERIVEGSSENTHKTRESRDIEQIHDCSKTKTEEQKRKKRRNKRDMEQALRQEMRQDYIQAPIPTVYGCDDDEMKIAFDVYKPNSSFSKMNPGLPDFYVAIVNFAEPSPPFPTLTKTIQNCDNITLRMAAVTDGGTVIMFGLTDFGVPSISSSHDLISDK